MGDYYHLTYEQWEQLGFPNVDAYVVDMDDAGTGFWLKIDKTDNDSNDIPDFLEKLAGGGDIILNPSQGVVTG